MQSELFENELEQSTELLRTGYVTAAAVIAGVVLETHIRTLCNERDIQIGKLDKMNSDLAKANVYNLSVQKRITAIADIRNKAAHGRTTEFVESDVVDMISYIQRFLSDYP
ncbi:MAG: DUF4145 domain-containing protein [Rhodoblastus sp.]|nr:DUF4145 domain-containing protein [Rhodoblastus sp.]